MATPPRPTNFDYLDPDAPRTKRIIEAALTVNVPWHEEHAPTFQPSKAPSSRSASTSVPGKVLQFI